MRSKDDVCVQVVLHCTSTRYAKGEERQRDISRDVVASLVFISKPERGGGQHSKSIRK